MAKHTPGPWKFSDGPTTAGLGYKPVHVITGGKKQVASFSWNDDSPWFPTRAESEANARLIAAAPELLDALKACHLQMLQSNNNSEYAEEANQLAISAISKATGVQS